MSVVDLHWVREENGAWNFNISELNEDEWRQVWDGQGDIHLVDASTKNIRAYCKEGHEREGLIDMVTQYIRFMDNVIALNIAARNEFINSFMSMPIKHDNV